MLIGVETNPYRIELAKKMGLADYVFAPDEAYDQIMKVTNGNGVERAFDASASDPGRQLAIRATREWGRIAFVGEREAPVLLTPVRTLFMVRRQSTAAG